MSVRRQPHVSTIVSRCRFFVCFALEKLVCLVLSSSCVTDHVARRESASRRIVYTVNVYHCELLNLVYARIGNMDKRRFLRDIYTLVAEYESPYPGSKLGN